MNRNNIKFAIPFLFLLCSVSCSDEFVEKSGLTASLDGRYLNTDQSSLSFQSPASNKTLGVVCNDVPWSLSKNSEWISLSSESGANSAKVNVSVEENKIYSTSGRSGFLTLKSSDSGDVISRVVAVNQESPSLALSVSSTSVILSGSESTESITVECNNEWTYSVTDDTWLTVTRNGNALVISSKENPTGAARTSYISIKSGTKDQTVTVTQKAATIDLSKQTLDFGSSSSSQDITIKSESSWTTYISGYDWITLSPTSGKAGTAILKVTVKGNTTESSRHGTFTINGEVVTVNQAAFGVQLSVSPSSVSLKGNASTSTIYVECNGAWTFQNEANWLKVSKNSNSLTITSEENSGSDTRSTYINITSGSKTVSVQVSQLPASITGLDNSLAFTYEASEKTVSFTSESAWTVSNSYSWIDVTPKSGNAGTTSLKVKVTENSTRNKRVGSFSVNGKTVEVTQEEVILAAYPSSLSFGESEGTQNLQIESNTPWTLSASDAWIQLEKTEGTNNANVKVTVSKNNESVRNGQIELKSSTGINTYVNVTQSGKGLVSINTLPYFVKDGGSYLLDPIESLSWTTQMEEGVDWIHVTPAFGSSSTQLTISVSKNKDLGNRNSYVDVTYTGGNKYRIAINQYGEEIITSATEYSFFAKGGVSEAINVKCVGNVSVKSSASWLSPKLSGGILTLTASENLTGSSRNAIVTLQVEGSSTSYEITVKQASQHGDIVFEWYEKDDSMLKTKGLHNGHEYVDLGLSVKWATMNVGAKSPEEGGNFYAWGETTPKSVYTWATYKYCNGTYKTLTKYCTSEDYGVVDYKKSLDFEDDAARVNWGGEWRMPTHSEYGELWSRCIWTWEKYNGVDGYKVTGENGNYIFIPAVHCRDDGNYLGFEEIPGNTIEPHGLYWLASSDGNKYAAAYIVVYYDNMSSIRDKAIGGMVRSVCP